jgi:hypothetical protein
MKRTCIFLIALCPLLFLVSMDARAESSLEEELKAMKNQMEAMQSKISSLEDRVTRQESEITKHGSEKEAYEKHIQELEAQIARQQEAPSQQTAIPKTASGKWTPEIGGVGDMVFSSTSNKTDDEGANRISLRELELVLGSNVDPYSRLDTTISFSDVEEPSLEEAYVTCFGLPLDTTARLGKFKPKVGKALGVHRDSLDTVDEPLVIQRYFGAEGMNKSGLDFTDTLDLPWAVTHQLVVGILEGGNGEEGTAFGTIRRSPTLYSHLKNYIDVSDITGLEAGLSYMTGAEDDTPNFDVQVLGADVTVNHHLDAIRTVKWQSEVFDLDKRDESNLWGAYSLLDYHFAPQWSVGARYDYVELVDNPADNPYKEDSGETGYLTFYQSEFARWRFQYTRTRLVTGEDDNTFYLQGTFAIGDHKHKLQ